MAVVKTCVPVNGPGPLSPDLLELVTATTTATAAQASWGQRRTFAADRPHALAV